MTPLVEVGQVWVRRSNGRSVRVTKVDEKWEDVTYRDVETGRTGAIFAFNMHHLYDLAPTDSPALVMGGAESGA